MLKLGYQLCKKIVASKKGHSLYDISFLSSILVLLIFYFLFSFNNILEILTKRRKSHDFLFQTKPMAFLRSSVSLSRLLATLMLLIILAAERRVCIRIPERIIETAGDVPNNQSLKTAVFALGSFWRSEAVFGCLNGVVQTTVGYAGGSKTNPEYRSLGDHAESVQVSLPFFLLLLDFHESVFTFLFSLEYNETISKRCLFVSSKV